MVPLPLSAQLLSRPLPKRRRGTRHRNAFGISCGYVVWPISPRWPHHFISRRFGCFTTKTSYTNSIPILEWFLKPSALSSHFFRDRCTGGQIGTPETQNGSLAASSQSRC